MSNEKLLETYKSELAALGKSSPKLPQFSRILKAWRTAKNMSLRDVEKKSGNSTSRQSVSRVEAGDLWFDHLVRALKAMKAPKEVMDAALKDFQEHQVKAA